MECADIAGDDVLGNAFGAERAGGARYRMSLFEINEIRDLGYG